MTGYIQLEGALPCAWRGGGRGGEGGVVWGVAGHVELEGSEEVPPVVAPPFGSPVRKPNLDIYFIS